MNLVWTRPAHQDRKSIRDYIATDNPIAAMGLDTLLSQKATNLIDYPGLG